MQSENSEAVAERADEYQAPANGLNLLAEAMALSSDRWNHAYTTNQGVAMQSWVAEQWKEVRSLSSESHIFSLTAPLR